jgi:hypothetical protein
MARPKRPSELEPWERQPRESEKAYLAFQAYLDMEKPRSIPKLAVQRHRHYKTLYIHSRRWNWADRVAAYDAHMDRIMREDMIQEDLVTERMWRHRFDAQASEIFAIGEEMIRAGRRQLRMTRHRDQTWQSKDGRTTIIRKATNNTLKDAAVLLNVGVRLTNGALDYVRRQMQDKARESPLNEKQATAALQAIMDHREDAEPDPEGIEIEVIDDEEPES